MCQKLVKIYLVDGNLPFHKQGKHSKRESLLSDEDIVNAICIWIRSQPPQERTILKIKEHIETNILPHKLGVPASIGETTLLQFMHIWGFRNRQSGQQIYFDGHEREDVQEYQKDWTSRMMEYRKKAKEFEGEEMEVVIEPRL